MDPIVLDARLVDRCESRCCDCDICEIPSCVCRCFCSDLTMGEDCSRVLVTLGQFSIIRLERDVQLLMPVYDYCVPDKECDCGGGCGQGYDDPCRLFQSISFPTEEFFPPSAVETPCDCKGVRQYCNSRK